MEAVAGKSSISRLRSLLPVNLKVNRKLYDKIVFTIHFLNI